MIKKVLSFTAAFFVLLFCIELTAEPIPVSEGVLKKKHLSFLEGRFPKSRQLLLVAPADGGKPAARLHAFEKKADGWNEVFPATDAVLGIRGIADENAKAEGDRKTPSGIFSLGFAFGYQKTCNTGLDYRRMTEKDVWIDDISSTDYNRCVSYDPGSLSHEKMRRRDQLYKYGVVINYNMNPVIKGKGSAIFLHVWKNRSAGTAGCVAVPEESMTRILKWLEKSKNPVIIIVK